MNRTNRKAVINRKVLTLVVLVVGIVGVGVVGGHYVRKMAIAREALAAGQSAYAAKDWPEARKQFRIYLSKYSDNETVLLQYAEVCLSIRPAQPVDVASAINAYRKYLRNHPGDQKVCDRLAKLYFFTDDFIELSYIARQRLSVAPADTNAMMWQGRALLNLNKLTEANDQLSKFVETKNSHSVEIFSLLGEIALQSENATDKAFKWIDQAVQDNPNSAEALAKRGKFYQVIKKNPVKARADFDAADQLQPTDSKVLIMLAEQWIQLHELDRAEAELHALEKVATTSQPDELDIERQDRSIDMLRVAAQLAMLRGDREKMIQIANRGLTELTDSHRRLFLEVAARLFLASDKREEARRNIEELRQALKQVQKPNQVMNERLAILDAAFATIEGNPYEAIRHLESLVAVGQIQDEMVWRHLANAYIRTGQDRLALAALEKYTDRTANDRQAIIDLARLNYRMGDWANVQKYAQLAENLKPDDVEPPLLRIEATLRLLGSKPDPVRVEPLSKELAGLRMQYPKRVEVRILQAMAADLQKKTDTANILEQAIAECDQPLPAILQSLEFLKKNNQSDKAIELAQTAMQKSPEVAALPIALSDLLRAAGKKDEARKILELSASKLPPDEAYKANRALVLLLQATEANSEAITLLRRMAADRPKDIDVRLMLLDTKEIRANEQDAQHIIDEIRTIEGERGLRWGYEQARLLLNAPAWKNRQQEIIQLLTRCTEADPGWSAPVLTLGLVYESLGKDAQAEEIYNRLIEKYPNNVNVTGRLLELLERQGRYIAATQILDKLPQVSEHFIDHRARLAIGRGDYETAMHDLKERITANPKDATSRVLLARLIYQQTKEIEPALKLLVEAQAIAPQLLSTISTRIALLHAEGRKDEAIAVLNAEVERRNDFFAHQLRADYFFASGQLDKAEVDYKKLTTFAASAVEGYLRLGNFYENTGKLDEALTAYEQGLKLEPARVELQRTMVRALLAHTGAENRARGQKMLDDMLKQTPEEPGLLALRAAGLLRQHQPEAKAQAISILERVVTLDPHNVTAHLYLVRNALDQGELAEASKLTAKGIGANPSNLDLLLVRASIEKELKNRAAAKEAARMVLEQDPQNVTARILLAQIALETGELDEAEKLVQQAVNLAPHQPEVHLIEAEILTTKNQAELAIQKLEAYRQTEPGQKNVKVLLALAGMYRKQGDFSKSEERVADAEKLSSGELSVFLERLRLLNSRKEIDKIIGLLSDRLTTHPKETPVLSAAASALIGSGDVAHMEKVKPLFERFVAQNPKNADANLALAILAYQTNDKPRAERAYRNVLEVDPYQREALNNLAWILSQEHNQFQEGLELANKGVLRYADDPNLLNTRGVIYFNLHKLTEANQDFQKCLNLKTIGPGTRVRTLMYMGRIAIRQGEKEKAQNLLAEALEIENKSKVLTPVERQELEKLAGAPTSKPVSG